MPFIVDESALVSAAAGRADLVFLHGIGEGADKGKNGLDAVRTRSPFLNQFACANFRLIAPQLADRDQRWGGRLDDLAKLIVDLRAALEDAGRPLFLCGFSIGGAGVVDAVNRFAAGTDIAISAWCSIDAALPNKVPLPAIGAEAAGVRHLIVRGPYGYRRPGAVIVPEDPTSSLSHHARMAEQVFAEGRPLIDGMNLYEWLLA